nr:unnamed protein product [Callosobruchus analis]
MQLNVLKNTNNETVRIGDIKIVRCDKENPNQMLYKTSYSQENFDTIITKLSRRPKKFQLFFERLYNSKPAKKKKKQNTQKEEWSREKAKIRRMNRMSYIGYTRDRKGKVFHNKERENRVMEPRCQSNKCMKYKNRFCINMKKDIERKFVETSRRSSTYNYFLKIGHENKQVCKSMFLSTLGLNEWMVANWCSTAVNGMIPSATISNASRRAARPKAVNDKRVEYLNKFFDDLPKMPSHYCRRDSKKLYLEYNFESKANLYRVYKEKCLTGQVAPLRLCHAFVMDVQAVKMSPVNNANKFYFKTRLKVHNLTIYDMSTHQCCNYWWNKTEGDLSSSVVKPGRSVIDPTVNNLRVLHYSPNSRIGYKLQFHDEMMELPQRSRDSQNCKDATRLFPARLKITQLKYDHLQEIKTTLDAEVHHFYNNLPH